MSKSGKNKRLGRGLEVFFNKNSMGNEIFLEALKADDEGDWLIAFHLYMKVAELNDLNSSKALNNAAVILAEHGFIERAIEFLKKAIELDSYNEDAIENLKILMEGKEK